MFKCISFKMIYSSLLCIVCSIQFVTSAPYYVDDYSDSIIDNNTVVDKYQINDQSGSTKDLYLIRTIIYEIGVLADADTNGNIPSPNISNIDITLFKPSKSDLIDLSKVPSEIKKKVDNITDKVIESLKQPMSENGSFSISGNSTGLKRLFVGPDSVAELTMNVTTI